MPGYSSKSRPLPRLQLLNRYQLRSSRLPPKQLLPHRLPQLRKRDRRSPVWWLKTTTHRMRTYRFARLSRKQKAALLRRCRSSAAGNLPPSPYAKPNPDRRGCRGGRWSGLLPDPQHAFGLKLKPRNINRLADRQRRTPVRTAFLFLLPGILAAQVSAPNPGIVRVERSAVANVLGVPGNLLLVHSGFPSVDAIAFSNQVGLIATSGRIRLVQKDGKVLGEAAY